MAVLTRGRKNRDSLIVSLDIQSNRASLNSDHFLFRKSELWHMPVNPSRLVSEALDNFFLFDPELKFYYTDICRTYRGLASQTVPVRDNLLSSFSAAGLVLQYWSRRSTRPLVRYCGAATGVLSTNHVIFISYSDCGHSKWVRHLRHSGITLKINP